GHRLVCHHGCRSSRLPPLPSLHRALLHPPRRHPAGKSDPPPVNCPRIKILRPKGGRGGPPNASNIAHHVSSEKHGRSHPQPAPAVRRHPDQGPPRRRSPPVT